MKNRLEIKPKVRVRPIYVVTGGLLTLALIIVLSIVLGGFSNSESKASNISPKDEDASVRWVVEGVSINESIEEINVEISSISSAYLQLKLYNDQRELLLKKSVKVTEGNSEEGFNGLSFLPKGKYLVVVSGEDKTVEKWVSKE
ncbi:MAG: hypothetical protein JXQ87_04720 [Bacteroidia bacterium]